jgi:hypothetical protein
MAFPLVQTAQGQLTSGTTAASGAITIAKSLQGNALIVVAQARSNSTAPVITVTDNLSSTYATISGTALDVGTQGHHEWFMLQNAPRDVTTITISATPNAWIAGQVFEVQGVTSADKVVQASSTSTSIASGSTATISQDTEFVIGVSGAHSSAAIGSATGFTMQALLVSSATPIASLKTGYAVNSGSVGTYSWTTSLGSSGLWVATVVTFKVSNRVGFNGYRNVSVGNMSRSEMAN